MRLGVSPAATTTPTGIFNQRFEALFPGAGALGYAVRLRSPLFIPVYLCANMGPQGLLVVGLPAPFVPHSASLGPAMATRVLSAPVLVSAPPTGLDECLFFYFLGVGPPCRSILCQFWLCEEAQCVYLRRHLGSPQSFLKNIYIYLF